MRRNDVYYVARDLEKVGGVAALQFKFNLRNWKRGAGSDNLPLVDRHDHVGAISIQVVGRALDPGLKNRLQCFIRFVDENCAESRILHQGEIRSISVDHLLPLGPLEVAGAIVGGLDGLDTRVAVVADPQGESMIAQQSIIGIKIDRCQRFTGGTMERARKTWMILERNDVFG